MDDSTGDSTTFADLEAQQKQCNIVAQVAPTTAGPAATAALAAAAAAAAAARAEEPPSTNRIDGCDTVCLGFPLCQTNGVVMVMTIS